MSLITSSKCFRFTGKFHRRSIRRGSKYKMAHRSPTELSKVKKVRRAKVNLVRVAKLFYLYCSSVWLSVRHNSAKQRAFSLLSNLYALQLLFAKFSSEIKFLIASWKCIHFLYRKGLINMFMCLASYGCCHPCLFY